MSDANLLTALEAAGTPVSISSQTGKVRTMEERVQRIRTSERSISPGSCQPGYSTWGN